MISLVDVKESGTLFDNHYRLKKKIGGGGFSEVWLAHDIVADLEVALKIYMPLDELDETGKEDFRREFARLCGLNHSNIIHAVGFGIFKDELPYLAMNVCHNGSAKKLIGNITEDELWDFIEQIASGLSYLHKREIIHQDMKPDNVLINSDGQYLIIDFGISTKTRNTLRKSVKGKGNVGGGTPWYMSVESFGTESPHIYARDIWAFGATLYELMTGDTPFGEYGGLSQEKNKGKIPEIKQDYSTELKSLVYECLALNAWDRPDADDILEKVKIHKGVISPSPTPIPLWKKAVSMGAAVVAIVCAVLLWSDKQTIKEEITVEDEILRRTIVEANSIVDNEKEKPIKKREVTRLLNAAKSYQRAMASDASDSAKKKGKILWGESQRFIDETYLSFDSLRIYYSDAESAEKKYRDSCLVLAEYVSEDLRLKLESADAKRNGMLQSEKVHPDHITLTSSDDNEPDVIEITNGKNL